MGEEHGDDIGQFQMDAAVQPGNSDGPTPMRVETLTEWSYPNSTNVRSKKQSGHC